MRGWWGTRVARDDGADGILARLPDLFAGRFDNSAQRGREIETGNPAPHGALHASVEILAGGRFSDCAFAIRGYTDITRPPYMARIYAFHANGPGSRAPVRLAVHYFDGDARFSADTLDFEALARIDPEEGRYYPGCDLSVFSRRNAIFCATDPESSVKAVGEIADAIEYYSLSFNAKLMHIRRALYGSDGALISGRSDSVPYKMRRLV
jgi:hypothetical protein